MVRTSDGGFSLLELIIVILVAAIILVFAMPQISSSRRLLSFTSLKSSAASAFRDARQQAMSQRKPITMQYNDSAKSLVMYGGDFGAVGASTNVITQLSGSGLPADDVTYGFPPGVTPANLQDGTAMTVLTAGAAEITFHGDGSVRDASDNTVDSAIFFYDKVHGKDAAFAISILGANGRVKVWSYSDSNGAYVE